jgi:NAD(P)-dependent dehydrogenase (short-subunit alcohol dehydrogenase family)
LGAYVPPTVVNNACIAAWSDTTEQWVDERTGIAARRYAGPGVTTSDLAVAASLNLLSEDRSTWPDIVAVIVATSTADQPQPATAAALQHKLRLPGGGFAFDLNAVCSGFLFGLVVAEGLLRHRLKDGAALVVAAGHILADHESGGPQDGQPVRRRGGRGPGWSGTRRIRATRESTGDRWRAALARPVYLCTHTAVPHLRDRGGSIINVSSSMATRVAVGAAGYCATKAAVEMFTRVTAIELGRYGIRVNALAPGILTEGMGKELIRNDMLWETYRKRFALGRAGDVAEAARAAVFLASDDASYVNGDVLEVNGGSQWA